MNRRRHFTFNNCHEDFNIQSACSLLDPQVVPRLLFLLRMGAHPHALSLGGYAPRSGRWRLPYDRVIAS
jgi:hypothetical protein